jgi:hypothetical protein
MAHLVGGCPGTERQAQGVDDEGLAAARLSGKQVEPGAKAHPALRDQRKVADSKFLEH